MANNNVNIVLKAVDKTKGAFRSVTVGLNAVKKAVFSLQTGLLSVGGIAGMGYLIKQSMNTIDTLGKTASKIGITTEALGGLRHAADLTGVSSNTLDMALQRMVRRVSEAAMGTGEAVKALKELNLDASKLAELSPDQQFKAIANAMEGVTNQSDKVRLAMRLFDSEGVALVNTLKGGSAAISEMEKEAERLGLRLSDKMVRGVENANDAITKLTNYMGNVFNRVVGELAPSIQAVTDNLMKWVELNIAEAGGPAEFAKSIGIAFLDAGESVVRSTAGMINSMISMANSAVRVLHKVLAMLPESMGGLRSQAAITKDLALQQQILTNKTREGSGASKRAIETTQLQVAALQELLDTGQYLKDIDEDMFTPFDPSGAIKGIQELRKNIQDTMGQTQVITDPEPVSLDLTQMGYDEILTLQDQYQSIYEGQQAEHYRRLLDQTTLWHQKNAAIQKEAKKGSIMTMDEAGRGIASALAGHNKKAFQLNKTFAIKDALIDTYKAVSKAWASAPFPANVAPAAIALAKGYATVQNIRATQFREKGGPITAGSPYVVGERGPELIVPSQSGTVVPNDQLRQAPNVTIQVNTLDATGFEDMLTRSRGALVNALNLGLNDQGKPGLT